MRGVITLVFDDGYEIVWRHVVPLLNELKLPAVFAIPLNTDQLAKDTGQAFTPWMEWLRARTRGHEIAAHSISHRDFRSLSSEQLQQELQQPKDILGAATLVYPGGAHNDSVVAAASKMYACARTTTYGFETLPPQDLWRLKTVDYTKDNFSLAKANARAAWASLTNAWLIETYHLVDNEPSTMHHSVRFEEFAKHLHFIKKLPLAVKTIHEVVGHHHH